MPTIKHQYDEKGNHRIVVDDKIGEWEHYQAVATLPIDDKLYSATTDYFGEGVKVTSLPIEVKAKTESVCRDCGEVFTWDQHGNVSGCEHVTKRSRELQEMLDRQFPKK